MADANFENYDENENSEDFEEDEKSEDYEVDETNDFPRVLKRMSSKIDYTQHTTLQLAKFHIEQLSYVMPIATHNGLLEMRMLTYMCYGYLGVSNCKYPSGVTLDPYISYSGDLGLLASAKGAWSKLDEFRFLQLVAAVGVRKIPLHQESEYFRCLSVEDRQLRVVNDARESPLPLSARAVFSSLRRRATGLGEAEIYLGTCAPLTSANASSAAAIVKSPGQHPLPLATKNCSDLVELVFTCVTADARQRSRNKAAPQQQRNINAVI
jgi:hypothetical protein